MSDHIAMWSFFLESARRGYIVLYTEILKDPAVFSKLYKKGKKTAGTGISAFYLSNKRPFNRFGITAGKKVGGAVERNRAKRIIRAAYRKNELLLPLGYDIVFVARAEILEKKSTQLDGFFSRLSASMKKSV